MDNLPEIKLSTAPFPKVPYLCNEEYDGLHWEEYPTRRGWDFKRLLVRDFREHPPAETASFLQNWLFFGAINWILGPEAFIPNADFLTHDEKGSTWVTVAKLDGHVRNYIEWLIGLENDMPRLTSMSSRMHRCLNDVAIFSEILYTSHNCPLPTEVVLSIKVFGCTIESALAWYWNIKTPRKWGLRDTATSQMLQNGWCLRDVSMTNSHLSEIAMFYASYAKRDYQNQDHSDCTEKLCTVNQVDESNYRTLHVFESCQCQHVEPDQEQIRSILKKGQVPVVSLTSKTAPDNSRILEVGIKAFAYSRWFIAISHVWSDGLGNPQRNSLPLCQLHRLYDLVVDLPWDDLMGGLKEDYLEELDKNQGLDEKSKGYFKSLGRAVYSPTRSFINSVRDMRGKPISIWIDTLCVPIDKEYRKMAIAGLKNVYSGSMYTLVLDSELQRISGLCSVEENILRIATSGWMRRAWTFQEAVFSNIKLKFKFADTIVNLPKLIRSAGGGTGVDFYLSQNQTVVSAFESLTNRLGRYQRTKETEEELIRKKNFSLQAFIRDDLETFFRTMEKVWYMPVSRHSQEDKLRRIISAWNGLQWRATSREHDKLTIFATACIMSVADFKTVQEIVNAPGRERMKLWLSQQQSVPEAFLFTKGPRIMEPGWRWAPASVHHTTIRYGTSVERSVGDTYLKVTKPGFIIFAGNALAGCTAFTFRERDSLQRYNVKIDTEYLPLISCRPTRALDSGGTLGLVMMKSGFDIKIGYGAHSGVNQEAGTLVEVTCQGSGLIEASFICTVDVKIEELDTATTKESTVLARSVKADQVWLIG